MGPSMIRQSGRRIAHIGFAVSATAATVAFLVVLAPFAAAAWPTITRSPPYTMTCSLVGQSGTYVNSHLENGLLAHETISGPTTSGATSDYLVAENFSSSAYFNASETLNETNNGGCWTPPSGTHFYINYTWNTWEWPALVVACTNGSTSAFASVDLSIKSYVIDTTASTYYGTRSDSQYSNSTFVSCTANGGGNPPEPALALHAWHASSKVSQGPTVISVGPISITPLHTYAFGASVQEFMPVSLVGDQTYGEAAMSIGATLTSYTIAYG
jgi:hypothetical protein